jgi:hypothetical protein
VLKERERMKKTKKPIVFKTIALEKFDPLAIARELLDPTVDDALRGVLLSGFLAWVVRPTKPKLRERAMRVAARQIYVQWLERVSVGGHAKSLDSKMRIEAFRTEVIDAFGREKVICGISRSGFRKDLKTDRHEILMALRMVEVWHLCVANGLPKPKKKLTLEKARATMEELGAELWNETLSARKLTDRAGRFGRSVAFSYSASRIPFPGGISLLDAIFEDRVTLDVFEGVKEQWFSDSNMVSNTILKVCSLSKMTRTKFNFENLTTGKLNPPSFPKGLTNRALDLNS